jgi:hypothetical protein
MTINQEFPVLDGFAPSWADVTVTASPDGAPLIEMIDIKSIKTTMSLEVGEQRGASGGRVLYRTSGSAKNEAEMTLYYSGFVKFLDGLRALAQTRNNQRALGFVQFGLMYQFTPPNSSRVYEVRIKGCRYMGRDMAPAEGPDAVTVDVKLNPLEIVDIVNGEECVLL